MKIKLLTAAIVLKTLALTAYASDFNKEAAIAEAKATSKAFAGALQGELMSAMAKGGPVVALEVCNVTEMPIDTNGASVSRVSLKNRNPNNVPNDWQRKILEDFDKRAADGEDIATMASVQVVENGDKTQLRFMKAVPTQGLCMACHSKPEGDLKAKLDELYPDDKATGYSVGEVRGALVYVKDH